MTPHLNRVIETVQMRGHNIRFYGIFFPIQYLSKPNSQTSRLERVFDDNRSIVFSYFSFKPYVVTPHLNCVIETVQMRGHKIFFSGISFPIQYLSKPNSQTSRLERVFDDNRSIVFSYFSFKPYVVTPHLNRFIETVQMRGHKIFFSGISFPIQYLSKPNSQTSRLERVFEDNRSIVFSYFSFKPYVVIPHLNRLIETV